MNTDTVNPQAPAAGPQSPDGGPRADPPSAPGRPALRRGYDGRMLAGVAAGLAGYLDVDVTAVRIAFVVLALLGGAGIPLYLAGLLLIPDEGSDVSIAGSIVESLQSR